MDWNMLIASGLSLASAVIVALITANSAKKSREENNKVILYRIDQLEEKQDKHNKVIERTFRLEERASVAEEKIEVANHRISDLEREVAK